MCGKRRQGNIGGADVRLTPYVARTHWLGNPVEKLATIPKNHLADILVRSTSPLPAAGSADIHNGEVRRV